MQEVATRPDTYATNAVATRQEGISVVCMKDGFANNAKTTSVSVVPPKVRLRCLFEFSSVSATLCVASMVFVCFGFLGGFVLQGASDLLVTSVISSCGFLQRWGFAGSVV